MQPIEIRVMEQKLEFHEKRMNNLTLSKFWRDKSEYFYWYYLNILTKPKGAE